MLCSKIIKGEYDVNDASEVPTLAPDLTGSVQHANHHQPPTTASHPHPPFPQHLLPGLALDVRHLNHHTPPHFPIDTLKDVQGLRSALFSCDMYQNEVLYRKWVVGLESGGINGMPPSKPKRIGKLITIAAEAHIRLELWLALAKRSFRHSPALEDQIDRRRKWKELAKLVYQDRTENADAAHDLRLSTLPESAANGEAPPPRDDSPLPDNFYE